MEGNIHASSRNFISDKVSGRGRRGAWHCGDAGTVNPQSQSLDLTTSLTTSGDIPETVSSFFPLIQGIEHPIQLKESSQFDNALTECHNSWWDSCEMKWRPC
ncbi:hypothetical protein AMECASPLE_018344 [Ameca splendens]|uniref:Uncharacterized protein n=1 Tax=Ameca splendens TaxID=208324 RepID=A0ABV0YDR8_9TELE